jgi:hypothetical protein
MRACRTLPGKANRVLLMGDQRRAVCLSHETFHATSRLLNAYWTSSAVLLM